MILNKKKKWKQKSYILSYFDYKYDFKWFFECCKLIIQIKIPGLINIENMHNMLYGCSLLKE